MSQSAYHQPPVPMIAFQTSERELTVGNKLGLHARPAIRLARCARQFASTIEIIARGERFSARQVVDILLADLSVGTTFRIVAEGPDAESAVQAFAALVRQFAEAERSPESQLTTDRLRWDDLDD